MTILAESGIIETLNLKIVGENTLLRFIIMFIGLLAFFAAGKTIQYCLSRAAKKREENNRHGLVSVAMNSLAKPANVIMIAAGLKYCRLVVIMPDNLAAFADNVIRGVFAIAVSYALFHLVDIVEYYMKKFAGRTDNRLDDMLVPIVRKSLRVVISIIAILIIAEVIFGAENIKGLLVSAGIGGMAIALAAKDTIANLFGSVNIFADRPFHIGEFIKVGEFTGTIEEVGFRSTRIRTVFGHLVTVPNSVITNAYIENISQRPAIRRTDTLTITYGSGPEGAEKAVNIIKELLLEIPEVNEDPENRGPRVYFNSFGNWALNIFISYWVSPADYWLAMEVHHQVNLEIMRRFRSAGIEFAFPSQTIYMDKQNAGTEEK
ncbi:MscS family inner membrane protein YnaI [Limihaloglobus sulfuriphilus]|uniref:MscS family inner membrane protein YnaI n=1 Tax=Limihaloglobus sulfuriphilus TaxID=1851148 RepID=A0A1R7T618_9BACT|nr:mechanosensitive ion channel family protein [Limihaloglobus sulfuriphilus]AQQ72156.1 MscS family inner membrane protein YnaI [Limihaloglobus sulfuriphilus]